MTFLEKIKQKQNDIYSRRPLTVAFLGDSVTQGCFEIYPHPDKPGKITIAYDGESVYHNQIRRILSILYPSVPFNILNAGISGDSAPQGLKRLESDVLSYCPDLTVVCYGLNDSCKGIEHLTEYIDAMHSIFSGVRASGSPVICMTPNVLGDSSACYITDPLIKQITDSICAEANHRSIDRYMAALRELCTEMNVPLCDCYALWKGMESAGVDTTALLSNKINHPIRELHGMFAYELVKLMLSGTV